jgi:hypothetical protein
VPKVFQLLQLHLETNPYDSAITGICVIP